MPNDNPPIFPMSDSSNLPPQPTGNTTVPATSTPESVSPKLGRKKTIALSVGTVLALGLVGGGAYAFLNNGSSELYDHVSDSALAYAQVNLNPSLSDKVALSSFITHLPKDAQSKAKNYIDHKDALIHDLTKEYLTNQDGSPSPDFAWVGDKVAYASFYDSGSSNKFDNVFIFKTSDMNKATTELQKLKTGSGSPYHVVKLSNNAIAFTDASDTKKILNTKNTLGNNSKYSSELKSISGKVSGGWANLDKYAKSNSSLTNFTSAFKGSYGQITAAVNITSKKISVDSQTYNVNIQGLKTANASTAEATLKTLNAHSYSNAISSIGLGGIAQGLKDNWAMFYKGSTKAWLDEAGIDSPDKIRNLVGDNVTLSISGDSFSKLNLQLYSDNVDGNALLNTIMYALGTTSDDPKTYLESYVSQTLGVSDVRIDTSNNDFKLAVGSNPTGSSLRDKGTSIIHIDLTKYNKIVSGIYTTKTLSNDNWGYADFTANPTSGQNFTYQASWSF